MSEQANDANADDDTRIRQILTRRPVGTFAVAGIAAAIVVAIYFAFYLLVYLPRGAVQ